MHKLFSFLLALGLSANMMFAADLEHIKIGDAIINLQGQQVR